MTAVRSRYGATLDAIASRAASAIVARGNIRSDAARAMLLRRLSSPAGHPDSLLSAPIYEAARIWKDADPAMQDLAGTLLRADLVDALNVAGDQAIPRDRHPYAHQLRAWKLAAQGKSFMVTSGTGSGKTECFMVPMLSDLLRQSTAGARHGRTGLILYPLNALIDIPAGTAGGLDRALRTAYLLRSLQPLPARQSRPHPKTCAGHRSATARRCGTGRPTCSSPTSRCWNTC